MLIRALSVTAVRISLAGCWARWHSTVGPGADPRVGCAIRDLEQEARRVGDHLIASRRGTGRPIAPTRPPDRPTHGSDRTRRGCGGRRQDVRTGSSAAHRAARMAAVLAECRGYRARASRYLAGSARVGLGSKAGIIGESHERHRAAGTRFDGEVVFPSFSDRAGCRPVTGTAHRTGLPGFSSIGALGKGSRIVGLYRRTFFLPTPVGLALTTRGGCAWPAHRDDRAMSS